MTKEAHLIDNSERTWFHFFLNDVNDKAYDGPNGVKRTNKDFAKETQKSNTMI